MRVRCKDPLPTDWINHPAGGGIIAECDITIRPRSRLSAKLLVFKSAKALHKFFREALGRSDLGRGCVGAVNGLVEEVIECAPGKPDRHTLMVDPKYFCLIGLVRDRLTMEIITHEACHAGLAYAKRRAGDFWIDSDEHEEENVCYPTGKIAAAINRFLHKKGLYQ